MPFNLNIPLSQIKGVGPKFSARLKKLDIITVKDLLFYFPFRYDDFSNIKKIKEIKIGDTATISGKVIKIKNWRAFKKRMFITEAEIKDETGKIRAVWFNQPYLINSIKEDSFINLSGKITFDKKGFYYSHPAYELLSTQNDANYTQTNADDTQTYADNFPRKSASSPRQSASIHTGRLVPVYPETEGITSRGIRYLMKKVLDFAGNIADPLPFALREKLHLPEINPALRQIHFPENLKEAEKCRKRFLFENFFYLQLNLLTSRRDLNRKLAPAMEIKTEEIKKFIASLPFDLTDGQRKIAWQILQDLKKTRPMNRLLEGDVGSGKTVVALIAVFNAIKNGFQAIFLAPTEILARQHFLKSAEFFEKFGFTIGLLTGSDSRIAVYKSEGKIDKKYLISEIKKGAADFIIGTHALLQDKVLFKNPALAVIDEQHRFGVEQRGKLSSACVDFDPKTICFMPHFLSMTATPIPRTLALAMYSDLDLSILEEMPTGRKNIITKIIPPQERNSAYNFIRQEITKGRQVFVICPRIEPQTNADWTQTYADNFPRGSALSPRLPRSGHSALLWETKAVKEEYEKLSKTIFPEFKTAMLHGRLKPKEKEERMKKFAAGETNILVSTSVVEVGIDVPNASVMMIEGAEHFGLAQLHQFRGRVGRAGHQSYCFVFSESGGAKTMARLKALLCAKNGFELAQKDLEIRGPGQFLGTKQSGMPDLIMEHLNNIKLITVSKEEARNLLENDPELKNHPLIKKNLGDFQKKIHLE